MRRLILVLVVMFTVPLASEAGKLVPISPEKALEKAELVIKGKIKEVKENFTKETKEDRTVIYAGAVVTIESIIKGDYKEKEITVAQFQGRFPSTSFFDYARGNEEGWFYLKHDTNLNQWVWAISPLDTMAREGILSKEEKLKKFFNKAELVAVVDTEKDMCMESYPCQHIFGYSIIKVLKGSTKSDEIKVHGSYTDHSNIPIPIKTTLPSGKFIIFLSENKNLKHLHDISVLHAVTWKEETEKMIQKEANEQLKNEPLKPDGGTK